MRKKSDVEREIIGENFGKKMRYEREIVEENFEKWENRWETIKKRGNKILEEIVGEKKMWKKNLEK